MGIFDPPQMPQFREAGGGWDWRQFADMMIPGNVWDSRTNEWRPRGIAAGAASTAFGPLAGALVEAMPDRMPSMPSFNGLGDWLSQRTGRDVGRGVQDPLRYADDYSAISGRVGGHRYDPRAAANRDNAAIAEAVRNTRGAGSTADWLSSGRMSRGESVGGGNMGGVTLGLGQLGRGGDEALAAASRAFYSRNGALMER